MSVAVSKPKVPLTFRELQIVKLMADGNAVKEIAKQLDLSFNSVNMFIKVARRAAGAKNAPALVATALRQGWIT